MAMKASNEQVLYLYGVVPKDHPLLLEAEPESESLPFGGGLIALVNYVPKEEFSSDELERKLQQVEWVAALARKHSAVLANALRQGPVYPARLCTLFSSARALIQGLSEDEAHFREKLALFQGRQEWGFKIFCDRTHLRTAAGATSAELRELAVSAVCATPGQAYVLRKKRERRLEEIVTSWIDRVVDEVLNQMAQVTVQVRLRPLLSEATTGRTEEMVANAAFLVDTDEVAIRNAVIGELTSRFTPEGFILELTGPWPAYSFCDAEGPDDGDEFFNRDALEEMTDKKA